MGSELALGPTGRLRLATTDDEARGELNKTLRGDLESQFAESNAAGLLALVDPELPTELPATLAFWRGWMRLFFRHLCQAEDEPGENWRALPPPAREELLAFVQSAPPMVGLEYLTAELLETCWTELATLVAEAATADPEGPAEWLRKVNPLAHLIGKVTFHLAENKRDPQRPFAFLATFSHKLSTSSKPQHRPLAEALKQSAVAGDLNQLELLLEPVRRAAANSPLVARLLKTRQLFAAQAWTADEAYRFLVESPTMESAGVVIRLPDWWKARRQARPQVQVRLGKHEPSTVGLDGLLDFDIRVTLGGEPLTPEELDQLISGAPGLAMLRGRWVEVDRAKLQEALRHWQRIGEEHPNGLSIIDGMRMLAGASIATVEDQPEQLAQWSSIVAGDWMRETLERMRSPSELVECEPGRDLKATLRPYQVEGVRWLWFMTKLGLGACLADDMGLGKTVQVLDLLLQRKRAAERLNAANEENAASKTEGANKTDAPRASVAKPSLLVVPASLLGNWKQEAARFAPSLRVLAIHRSELDPAELERRARDPEKGFADCDLVITSYGMVRRQPWLEKATWSLVILDEAQAIKNAGAAQTKAVKKLRSDRRILMTGTPVENHVGELWSLFDFSCPGLLGTAAEFKRFVAGLNKQSDSGAYASLRKLVGPYILRRQKTDPSIARDLPDKIEMRTECGLSLAQSVLYAKAVESLRNQLDHAEGMKRRGLVLASLMQFKQICNHPAQYLNEPDFPAERSGKFQRLEQLCDEIAARQEKVLVFTQFQSLCQPLADFLATVFHAPGLVLHGGTPVKRRAELVKEFQNDPDKPFFVISLKAGGSGLNLTAASHVIHFDRWWNPAVENQATDRAFRIGQQRNVLVHKFVCRGTIEERIDEMIAGKRAVAEQILDDDGLPKLSEMPNDELLRFVSLDVSRATAAAGADAPLDGNADMAAADHASADNASADNAMPDATGGAGKRGGRTHAKTVRQVRKKLE
jgi:non-specific serine/threonine protein kinase